MFTASTALWGNPKNRWPLRMSTDPVAGPAPAGSLRKVLVVDDEADLADLAAMLLTAHGLEVLTAYSGEEALRLLGTDSEIDAVVTDVVMPGMTGLELGDAIGRRHPHVKVVLVSGFAPSSLPAGRERASYLFAAKPYKVETLLKLLFS
jgi:DNA-binding NtrC family response regulator